MIRALTLALCLLAASSAWAKWFTCSMKGVEADNGEIVAVGGALKRLYGSIAVNVETGHVSFGSYKWTVVQRGVGGMSWVLRRHTELNVGPLQKHDDAVFRLKEWDVKSDGTVKYGPGHTSAVLYIEGQMWAGKCERSQR